MSMPTLYTYSYIHTGDFGPDMKNVVSLAKEIGGQGPADIFKMLYMDQVRVYLIHRYYTCLFKSSLCMCMPMCVWYLKNMDQVRVHPVLA